VNQDQRRLSSGRALYGPGRRADYESDSSYYGGHLGLGYAFQATDRLSIDLSSKYLWTRQDGDRLNIAGHEVEFDSVSSRRWRNGLRLAYESESGFSPYAGAAFEYEFSGQAEARVQSLELSAPRLRGGTGIGEIDLSYKPGNSGLFVEAGLQGYTGQREGLAGRLQFGWNF